MNHESERIAAFLQKIPRIPCFGKPEAADETGIYVISDDPDNGRRRNNESPRRRDRGVSVF